VKNTETKGVFQRTCKIGCPEGAGEGAEIPIGCSRMPLSVFYRHRCPCFQ
jgi:hypothetical protein